MANIFSQFTTRLRARKDITMEGGVAKWYAKIRKGDLSEFQKDACTIVNQLQKDAKILDVASGPGYLAIEIAKICKCSVTGLDISHSLVRIATENALRENVVVDFRQGSASAMPFQRTGKSVRTGLVLR